MASAWAFCALPEALLAPCLLGPPAALLLLPSRRDLLTELVLLDGLVVGSFFVSSVWFVRDVRVGAMLGGREKVFSYCRGVAIFCLSIEL